VERELSASLSGEQSQNIFQTPHAGIMSEPSIQVLPSLSGCHGESNLSETASQTMRLPKEQEKYEHITGDVY
jgi:hypothetical protein